MSILRLVFVRLGNFSRRLVILPSLALLWGDVRGDSTTAPLPTITDPLVVWSMSSEQKSRRHPLQIEGRVSYYDPGFHLFWLEKDQVGQYVQLSQTPPKGLRTGQYVRIEGFITPTQGLDAAEVTVTVLQDDAPLVPVDTQGRINDVTALASRLVTTEGYVDSQQVIDAEHVRLLLIIENRPVICWVKPDDPRLVPDWQGKFIRVTGLYSARFDPTQTGSTIELWLGKQSYLEVTGSLGENVSFDQAPHPINELYRAPVGSQVLVRGRIETHEVGSVMTIRDATGQVEVRSIQQQRLPVGTVVEALGRIDRTGGRWVIDAGLYRRARGTPASTEPSDPASTTLQTAAEVRALGGGQAAQGRQVDLTGMVSWSLPESEFFFLQDITGSVRVYYDRKQTGVIPYQKYLRIQGVTKAGRVAPTVELKNYSDLGSMSHPKAKPITLEQALTGREDGEWVELRGFLQKSVSEGEWRWIHVTTPAGEFVGHLLNPVDFTATPGSLIRMRGVCETNLDPAGKISGITLRVPFLHDIAIEEEAPADFFNLPLTSLADLEQIALRQGMLRVRVAGTVVHAVPGQRIFLEQGDRGLLLLTPHPQPLQAGDRIEAVGILGREGARTILREAVFQKVAGAVTSTPLPVEDPAHPMVAADSRLVRLRGTLTDVDTFHTLGQTRLTLQQDDGVFEAQLDQGSGLPELENMIGAGLEITGIYQVKFDDFRQARGFQILLRSPADVVVYQKPRLVTLQRALMVVAVLGGCVLLGLYWIRSLRRQVQQQTTQLRIHLEHQARLEAEVQRAARLESLGVLAGGIAHDYNNLLTIIMGNLSLMKFTPQVVSLEGVRLEEIEKATLRARDLTRQLLTFAEGGEPVRTFVDTAELLHSALASIPRSPTITYDQAIGTDLPPLHVDRDQILQALQNLLGNALDAMPGGGCLRLMAAKTEIVAGFNPNLSAGRYVRISVADTGNGIPAAMLPRIFDPYFTTKKAGGGLGLATVYSIVKKHQGHIEAQSRPRQGATFTLWLPVAESTGEVAQIELPLPPAETAPAHAAAPAPAPLSGPARILLMDDEESIRKLGKILLERLGCEVVTARDGTEALHFYRKAQAGGNPFSLLLLDLTVNGGMGGLEVIQQVRAADTTTPAIVSSGYSRDPVMAHFRTYGFQGIIPKPYDIKRFRETVLSLLPGGTPPGRPPG